MVFWAGGGKKWGWREKETLTVCHGNGGDCDVAALDLDVAPVPDDARRWFGHPHRALELERLVLLDLDLVLLVARYLDRLRWRCKQKLFILVKHV